MHRQIRRVLAAGGAALSALGIAVASVACGGTTTAPQAPQPSGPPATQPQPSGPPGAQLWIQRYKLPPRSGPGYIQVVAVSPRGDKAYMTGEGATVAYSAATGARLWASHGGASVAVSPDGAKVFVTGGTGNPGQRGPQSTDYATAAYSAATGARLWASRYNAPGKPGGHGLGPKSVVVSPGGDKVFVTGISAGAGSGPDYATVAYSASTGAQLWASRYNGPGNGPELMFPGGPQNAAVSRDGATVYVTGASKGTGPGSDAATVAYSATTGKQLWLQRYNGPASRGDNAWAMAVSPGGAKVYVTGHDPADGSGATVAYSTSTGAQLWVTRYAGYNATAVAVSPNGATVFVAGCSNAPAGYVTVAYRG